MLKRSTVCESGSWRPLRQREIFWLLFAACVLAALGAVGALLWYVLELSPLNLVYLCGIPLLVSGVAIGGVLAEGRRKRRLVDKAWISADKIAATSRRREGRGRDRDVSATEQIEQIRQVMEARRALIAAEDLEALRTIEDALAGR